MRTHIFFWKLPKNIKAKNTFICSLWFKSTFIFGPYHFISWYSNYPCNSYSFHYHNLFHFIFIFFSLDALRRCNKIVKLCPLIRHRSRNNANGKFKMPTEMISTSFTIFILKWGHTICRPSKTKRIFWASLWLYFSFCFKHKMIISIIM